MKLELLLTPACPNAAAARALLAESLDSLGLAVPVHERVGAFPSPTILVDGVDVMTGRSGTPQGHACRRDLPTISRLHAALRGRASRTCQGSQSAGERALGGRVPLCSKGAERPTR